MNRSKSSTSIKFAGTTDGVTLHPNVVYKAENLRDSRLVGGPKWVTYNRSQSGWFDMFQFEDWFDAIIMTFCRRLEGNMS